MKTLDRILAHAALHPERTAYRAGDGSLTYGELLDRAKRGAQELLRLDRDFAGSLPGPAPVLLDGSKSPDAAAAILACLTAGIPYVPLAPSIPKARFASVVRQTGARLILAGEDFPDYGIERIPLRDFGRRGAAREMPETPPSEYAYIIFTSGSTGEPKGVPVFRESLDRFVGWISSLTPLAEMEGVTVLNQALFSFDLSVADLFFALSNGHTEAAFRSEEELARILPEADAAVLTPTFLRQLLLDRDFRAENYPRLKCVWSCGETLNPQTAKQVLEAFPGLALLNAYGPTEACSAVSAVRITEDMTGAELPVGIVSEAAADIAVEDGEIVLRGPSVFGGYLGGLEGGHFRENGQNCYRTGDLGRIEDGLLYCSGRKDAAGQIKYKGYRIELADIESNLASLTGVAACAVTAKRGRDGAVLAIRAFAELLPGADLSPEAVKEALAERLPDYMIPKTVRILDRLPVTENGKTDRKALESW